MTNNNSPLPTRRALGRSLDGALQWRLCVWILATLLCALSPPHPVWAGGGQLRLFGARA